MRLCINCVYFARNINSWANEELQIKYGFCMHPSSRINYKFNLVNGEETWAQIEARKAREFSFNRCGKRGRFYKDNGIAANKETK